MTKKELDKKLKSRDKRLCSQCGKMKKYVEFGWSEYSRDKFKFRSPCKKCQNSIQRKDPKRPAYRFKKYKMTPIEYKQMLDSQGGVCVICKTTMDRACIDHAHTNNKVRGILCNSCNAILGFSKENINILKSAIIYLNSHKT